MKHVAMTCVLAFILSPAALAADTVKNGQASPSASGIKLMTADCDALWLKADPQKSGKLGEEAAKAYLTDVKSVNIDGDTQIEHPEFSKACEAGLIKREAANMGAPATTGSTKSPAPSETSDRTPEKKSPTPPEQTDTSGGKTSDRTPQSN